MASFIPRTDCNLLGVSDLMYTVTYKIPIPSMSTEKAKPLSEKYLYLTRIPTFY